jgi:hypothetical protein
MGIEYDEKGNAYDVDFIEQRYKICPITGLATDDFSCYNLDCSKIEADKSEILYGCEYHCDVEKKRIVDEFNCRLQRKMDLMKADWRRSASLEVARKIELEEFFSFCKDLETFMYQNRQAYNKDFVIIPYRDPEDLFLVFWYEKDTVIDFSVSENIVANVNVHFSKMKENPDFTVSYRIVPGYLAEAIRIYFCIKYGVDTKNILRDDNPVYVKARNLKKYLDSAYGMSLQEFRTIRQNNPGMTEIVDFDSVIMIKQEIDEAIRRDSLLKS